jgi:hypothetical protein
VHHKSRETKHTLVVATYVIPFCCFSTKSLSISIIMLVWMGSYSRRECIGLFNLISINISSLRTRPWRPILSQRYVLFAAGFKQAL